jgi:ribonuclease HI
MTVIQREFYRSARGPAPTDEDVWSLIFDAASAQLTVRHEWMATGHSGVDEYEIAEFLAQEGAARTALIETLFGEVAVRA